MHQPYTFTVFTATYNRATTLHRVHESLRRQTYRDFEWLVVDDGSTDDTRDLIERWRSEADFPIRYLYQENAGKHVAHNRGAAVARGTFFLSLDSDDGCVPQALSRFKHHWDNIPDEQQARFFSVTALSMDQAGRIVGSKFPRDVWDADSLSANYKYKIRGDKWGFAKTAVLREFPLPEPEVGTGAIPEGLVWLAIARQYRTRFVNEPLLINFKSQESLSHPRYAHTNAVGNELYHRAQLNRNIDYLFDAPIEFLRSAAQFVRFSLHLGRSPLEQWRALGNRWARALWILGLPIGTAAYFLDPSPHLQRSLTPTKIK